jgi:hypothetical protein
MALNLSRIFARVALQCRHPPHTDMNESSPAPADGQNSRRLLLVCAVIAPVTLVAGGLGAWLIYPRMPHQHSTATALHGSVKVYCRLSD